MTNFKYLYPIYLINNKMSFIWGCLTGTIVGVYFGEKNIPFPIKYNPRSTGGVGSLELDLQVANTIAQDLRNAVGWGPV